MEIRKKNKKIIRVVEESGLSRWPWTLEHAGSNPAYPTSTKGADGRVKAKQFIRT
jgi:hypothetical protein